MSNQAPAKQRRTARDLAGSGRLRDAIAVMQSLVAEAGDTPNRDDHALLSLYHFNAGEPIEAAKILIEGHRIWPNDVDLLKNIGVCYSRAGAAAEAREWLLRAVERDAADPNLHDSLADVLHRLGDEDKARAHGEKSLLLKDQEAATSPALHDPTGCPIPPFDPKRPERNVIAFSLWGTATRYLEGALQNARLAPHIYPGWRCRFYVDGSVPDRIQAALLAAGADILRMPDQSRQYDGLFWRFLAAFDPAIDRYLVRDADSLINIRERLAVDAWLDSGRHFHVMRDHHTHTDTMLAGLWGGVSGALPDLSPRFADYLDAANKTANCDQKFLRQCVWPSARQSALTHDSRHTVLEAQAFPGDVRLGEGRHVGQDASIHPVAAGTAHDVRSGTDALQARKRFVFTITPGRTGTTYLAKLLEQAAPGAECHHERTGFDRMGAHSPDASTFMLFNSQGNVGEVRDFWRRKFGLIRRGRGSVYIETSHYLAKAGLIENLDLLGDDVEIDLIDLRRDLFSVVWSTANRFDFANRGFTWLFALDPAYPRRIIDPAPLRKHGMVGDCLWYVAEIYTRAEYYRRLLADRPNVTVRTVHLEDLSKASGARTFLNGLNLAPTQAGVQLLPSEKNDSKVWPLGNKMKEEARTLIENAPLDPAALAEAFIAAGRRLSVF